MAPTALIIDDEPDIRELLELTLRRMGVNAVPAATKSEALALLEHRGFDLCLTDMRLPDGDGLEIVEWIQQRSAGLPVAVITAHGNVESAVQALKAGAFDFVSKPVDLAGLRKLVDAALRISATPREAAPPAAPGLLGDSAAIEHVRALAAKVARSQAPVHIYGESGTGKELVARMIHDSGARAAAPFVPVNCGAIPSELMESEFFGHRKGSFTGADQDKAGLFQAAHGGTLFLDEIADLPLHMQVKLLRAIQEKAIRPVGSRQEIPVDVRILSATHKNLTDELESGRLRQDLYYRINVIELHVPPLRERMDDIPLLVDHILRELARENGQPLLRVDAAVFDAMQHYNFPGNVRELENILQRACALTEGQVIRLEDLPELEEETEPAATLHSPEKLPTSTHPIPTPASVPPPEAYSLEKHLEEVEREVIRKALEAHKWNRTAAARTLGMSFRSFRYRLKKLGLD